LLERLLEFVAICGASRLLTTSSPLNRYPSSSRFAEIDIQEMLLKRPPYQHHFRSMGFFPVKTLLNFSTNLGKTGTVANPATPAPATPRLEIPFKAAPPIAAL
jgi:hypothetical protein